MNAHNYTTPRLKVARGEIEKYTLEANKARLLLDFATEPKDVEYQQARISYAEQQIERWRTNIAQMEAEDVSAVS